MELAIHESWKNKLKEEFEKPYFLDLMDFVEKEYTMHTCYPEMSSIFAAFNACSFQKTGPMVLARAIQIVIFFVEDS